SLGWRARFDGGLALHQPRGERPGDALDRHLTHGCESEPAAGVEMRPLADDDASRRRQRLEPRRDVDRLPGDEGVAIDPGRRDDLSRVDPDAHGEVTARMLPE